MRTPPAFIRGQAGCRSQARGFALLITITLLAFLVLLLVSLAALTRVETQVASNNQQLAQARQNALMALNIAIGQLQKYAGPDQRVTATADLVTGNTTGARVGANSSVSLTVGGRKYWDTTNTLNGLNRVQAGTRYWTGVWGNLDPATPTAGNGNIYEKTPRPVLLNWLVSGNESATFTTSVASGNFGQVTTVASGVVKTPSTAATPAITTATKATDTLTLGTGRAVLLVGANTAGTQSRTVETATETAMDRYVIAPNSTLRFMKPLVALPRFLGASLSLLTAVAPARAVEWVGTKGSEFSDPANWRGEAPVPNSENRRPENFFVLNGSLPALRYTEAQGNTSFGAPDGRNGQFIVGFEDRWGSLEMTGGVLQIYSYWSPIVAQLGSRTTGSIHVSGGVLRISNTSRSLEKERFFRVGNTKVGVRGASGELVISGGLMIIATEGGPEVNLPDWHFMAGGLNVGRSGGDGVIHITGGTLRVTSPYGTSFVPDNGPASGVLAFGPGAGVFEQTHSHRLTFGDHPDSQSYISFLPGSNGALSLAGASREVFDDYIKQGRIRMNGVVSAPSAFSYAREGVQGVLRLAGTRSASK